MEKIYLSKSDVDVLISQLISKIVASSRSFKRVIGIANGGLNVSIPIAKALGLDPRAVRISCYEDTGRRSEPLIEDIDFPVEGSLIVDDLIDGGTTFKTFESTFGMKKCSIAVLFWNFYSRFYPDYYVKEKPNAWLIFPWERQNENH